MKKKYTSPFAVLTAASMFEDILSGSANIDSDYLFGEDEDGEDDE